MKTIDLVLAGIAAVLLTAAAGASDGARSTPEHRPNVSADVTTDRTSYTVGQPVKIALVVHNRSNRPMTYRFSSGKQFDAWVEKDGKEVWRHSRGLMYTQALTSVTIAANESRTFTVTWKQVGNDRRQVSPGAYVVKAQLTPMNSGQAPSAGVPITIRTHAKPAPTPISAIVSKPQEFKGKTVSIEGTYRGWKPDRSSPACKEGPPVSRSDWAVSDKTGCIYAHGPSGLDPISDQGKPITVRGRVMISKKGQPYLRVLGA